jgi:soluble lytic murein transglycosylase
MTRLTRVATIVLPLVAGTVWPSAPVLAARQQSPAAAQDRSEPLLKPTAHAALPQDVDDFWLVPPSGVRKKQANAPLAAAADAYTSGRYPAALSAAERAYAQGGPLSDYAALYQGLAELRLSHGDSAKKVFDAIIARQPDGYLAIAALLARAEAAELNGDNREAADLYARAVDLQGVAKDDVLSRLGRAALASGDRKRAAEAYLRVYYEFPLSENATAAGAALATLEDAIVRNGYKLDLGRASVLFGARRYAEARSGFQDIQRQTSGDDRELVDLRLAECDYYLKRYQAVRDALEPYLDKAARKAEARFFYLGAVGQLGDSDRYISLTHALVSDFPDSSWAEEALNNLGTYYILNDQDDLAAATFREVYDKFPNGSHAERAAWKYGWWCYKTGNYAETVRVFEAAAAGFARSDYRPSYLYWAARARAHLGDRATADARLRLVYTDYMNSYYGRLAERRLSDRALALGGSPPAALRASVRKTEDPAADLPPTAPTIRLLLSAGLYDDALNELRYAQKAWGTSPVIDATIAWVYHQQGALRPAISLMRRAYPQHLASGGEDLPAEILQVIYPLTYWTSIKKYSAQHHLDPYLVAALIAQESTFDADVVSRANAWGLMQLVPATGRSLARSLGIRRFRTSMLTTADLNVRLGTLYFSRLVEQFGGTYYALASYNAGENRVVRWKSERPGLDEDEFIDDIPFPETQNYVKRILGTAEDYRRIYGEDGVKPEPPKAASDKSPATHASAVKKPATKKAPAKKKAPSSKKKKRRPGGG